MKVLSLALSILLPAVATAEVTIDVTGTTVVTADDVEGARAHAEEDALRQAVAQAVAGLVTPEARKSGALLIKKRILRQARTWVTRSTLVETALPTVDGKLTVRLSVVVNDLALAAELRRLKLPLQTGTGPENTDPDPAPRPGNPAAFAPLPRPKIAVLVVYLEEWGEPMILVAALVEEIRNLGFEAVPLEPAVSPVDDETANVWARDEKAGAVLVASAVVHDAGPIRATRLRGADLDVLGRLLDGTTRVAEARTAKAGFGADDAAAQSAAASAGAKALVRALATSILGRWPAPTISGGVRVTVTGLSHWNEVDGLIKQLAGVPGVTRVLVRGLGKGRVELEAAGAASPQSLARSVSASGRARLDPAGGIHVTVGASDMTTIVPEND